MKVFVNEYIDPGAYNRLKEKVELSSDLNCIEEYDAMLIKKQVLTREMIARAKKCKIIARHGVGCDMIDLDAAKEYGIPVVNIPGVNAESVAELAVSFMLTLARKIKYYDKGLHDGIFPEGYSPLNIGCELKGKTVALVGTGNISQRVAEIMQGAFKSTILAYSPNLTDEKADANHWIKYDNLYKMLEDADIVNVSVPLTDSTRGMIGKEELAYMKKSAMLVNSRGDAIDEDDLYIALKENKIAGAALDTFHVEPLPKDSKLRELEQVILTPHMAGATVDNYRGITKNAVKNIMNVLNGELPVFCKNPEIADSWKEAYKKRPDLA